MAACCGVLRGVQTTVVVVLMLGGLCSVLAQQPTDVPVLRVAGVLMPPYLDMVTANQTNNSTNSTASEYTGFIKELLDALTKEMGYSYELYTVDGFGSLGGNGQWTGMIGEVVQGNADMTAGPLIATTVRERAVDFTSPFQKFEATIVMRKRHWNQKPRITSLEELVSQDEVVYGIAKPGSIYNFLKVSEKKTHSDMFDKMENNSVVHFKENNNKGVRRARMDSNYAFILEGAAADYVVGQEPCDLQAIKAGFYQRQYAFAVANQSPLRDIVNEAMVELKFNGVLQDLQTKWLAPDNCNLSSGGCSLQRCLALSLSLIAMTLWPLVVA